MGHQQTVKSHAARTSPLHDLPLLRRQQRWLHLRLRSVEVEQLVPRQKRAQTRLPKNQAIRPQKGANEEVSVHGPLQAQRNHGKQILLVAEKGRQIRALDEHSLAVNEEQGAKLQAKTHLPGFPFLLPHLPHRKAFPVVRSHVPAQWRHLPRIKIPVISLSNHSPPFDYYKFSM